MPVNAEIPRVSVLMPVYNGGRFLESAVLSVLAQTFTDFELIAVDDGSIDETPQILQDLARRDGRIRVLRQENTGIVGALNNGLARCRGAYVARMDGDDLCLPHRFAEQVAYLDAHPDCVLVGGLAETIDEHGRALAVVSGGPHRRTRLDIFPPKVAVSLHPLVMMRRSVLLAIGGYRDAFPHAEDYDLYIRLSAQGTIDNPARVMLKYRKHEGAISQRNIEAQERSAALAEIDAIEARRNAIAPGTAAPAVPANAFETYVRYRIWRRFDATYRDRSYALRRQVIAAILSPRLADLFSGTYNRLRFRMAGGVLRSMLARPAAPAAASVAAEALPAAEGNPPRDRAQSESPHQEPPGDRRRPADGRDRRSGPAQDHAP